MDRNEPCSGSSHWPRSLVMPPLRPSSASRAVAPRRPISAGRCRTICCASQGRQAAISVRLGLRLPGGRHLITLAMYKSRSLSRPAAASSCSSSLPARPTKGWPLASSSAPGASPISSSRACGLPRPTTTRWRLSARPQRWHWPQVASSFCRCGSSAAAPLEPAKRPRLGSGARSG